MLTLEVIFSKETAQCTFDGQLRRMFIPELCVSYFSETLFLKDSAVTNTKPQFICIVWHRFNVAYVTLVFSKLSE